MSTEAARIVVVDDSWVILEQIRASLSRHGYDVRTTTGVDTASRLARGADLVIIDFHMPGMNGSELVGMLRKSLPIDTPCVFYLYTSDPTEAARYATHGFDGAFFRKGDEDLLATQVDAVFRTIRMRRLAERMRQQRSGLFALDGAAAAPKSAKK